MADYIVNCEHLQVFHTPEYDGCVVFNAESCECHYLDGLSAKIFFMFYGHPLSRSDLLINVAKYLNTDVVEELVVFVDDLIHEFGILNIVESVEKDIA